MKSRLSLLFGIALFGILSVSCNKDIVSRKSVEAGLPVALRFSFSTPAFPAVAVKASDAQESEIKDLALVFFSKDNTSSKAVVVPVIKSQIVLSSQPTSTNYIYSVTLSEEELEPTGLVSGDWYLYAIANYNTRFCGVNISEVATFNHQEFLDHCLLKTNNLIDFAEAGMLMSGRYGETSSDGRSEVITLEGGKENTLAKTIHLKRLTSKVSFTLKSGSGVTFTPETYSIYNLSQSSSLMERSGWSGDKGSLPGSLGYLGVTPADDNFTTRLNEPIASDGTFYFYMMENVQVPASSPATWTYASREKRAYSAEEPYGDFLYAPANATYVVIKGYYQGPGKTENGSTPTVSGNVSYTIHLGDWGSDFSNFSVRRNYKYNYTVNINGVNSIITEVQTASEYEPTENNPGAEGDIVNSGGAAVVCTLDAHYETVLMSFDYDATVGMQHYSVRVRTPFADFVDYDGNNKPATADASDYSWIEFGKPEVTTTTGGRFSAASAKSYPGPGNVTDIYGLIADLKNKNTSSNYYYYRSSQKKVYVVAYINEYFYEDKDRSEWVNADDRVMTVSFGATQQSRDLHSLYTSDVVFSFTQKSIKSFYDLSVERPFGIESVEETPATYLGPDGAGSDTYAGSSVTNGWSNTLGNLTANGTVSWSSYVNASGNAFNGSTSPTAASIMQTAYNSNIYQCLSRNRDNNGDGKLDKDEVRWYMPSVRQCVAIWFGERTLPVSLQFDNTQYPTSTAGGYRVWWAKEGTAMSSLASADAESKTRVVRCVRNLGDSTAVSAAGGDVTTVFRYNTVTRVATLTSLQSSALRSSGSQHGEYAEHVNTDLAAQLPQAIRIAKENLTGVSITEGRTAVTASGYTKPISDSTFYFNELFRGSFCQDYYYENEDKSDLGEWRIPNEKELYLIYRCCLDEFRTGDGSTQTLGAKTKYNRNVDITAPDGSVQTYFIYVGRYDSSANDPIISTGHSIATTPLVIRCVRDADPEENDSDAVYSNGGSGFGLQ